MSERAVRIILKVLLSAAVFGGVMDWAMYAWPAAEILTPPQALFVLSSIVLWTFVGAKSVSTIVGGPLTPEG